MPRIKPQKTTIRSPRAKSQPVSNSRPGRALKAITTRIKSGWGFFYSKIESKRALIAALSLFLLLSVGIAAALTNSQAEGDELAAPAPLAVDAFVFGEVRPYEETVGTIINETTLTLVAQTAGPVSRIALSEGATVNKGALILQQDSAYNAGQAAYVSLDIARKNQELAGANLDSTKRQVELSRTQADLSRDNAGELRDISRQSISETKSMISLIEQIVSKLEDDIKAEQAGANDPNTLANLRQALANPKASLNQTRSQLRSLEYQVDEDAPQAQLSEVAHDLAYQATAIQLTTAAIQADIAALNLRSAQIMAAASRVSSPLAGRVERILVRPGQYLNPGTPVAVIRGETKLLLEVLVAARIGSQINQDELALVTIGDEEISLPISHLSAAPTAGNLHEVLIEIPSNYQAQTFENMSVQVKLPLYQVSAAAGHSFIPLDSIFVTNTERFVFVVEDGRARKRPVETGQIVGSAIELKTGLMPGDVVIIDRRVIDAQAVEATISPTTSSQVEELG